MGQFLTYAIKGALIIIVVGILFEEFVSKNERNNSEDVGRNAGNDLSNSEDYKDLDFTKILGQSPKEVDEYIGKYSQASDSDDGVHKNARYYETNFGELRVDYLDNPEVADAITLLNSKNRKKFTESTITDFGFQPSKPSVGPHENFFMRWNKLGGKYEVSMFNKEEHLMVYVCGKCP